MVVGSYFPLGVGWQGCKLHTHIHTPPTSARSSPSLTLPWHVRLPHAEPLLFSSRAGSSPSRSEGSASSSAHRFGCVFIRTHMRSCSPSRRGRVRFSSRTGHCAAGSHAVGKGAAFQWSFTISTERNRVCFLLRFVGWCKFPRARIVFWGC